MPSYSSAFMFNLLPKEVINTMGNRLSAIATHTMQQKLERATALVDEAKELRALSEDAKEMNDLGIASYLADLADGKEKEFEQDVKRISLQVRGRIFKPKVF